MKKFLSVTALLLLLGLAVPAGAEYTNISTYTDIQPDENAISKSNKSETIFTRIGYVIGTGLVIWFIISRFTRKKK